MAVGGIGAPANCLSPATEQWVSGALSVMLHLLAAIEPIYYQVGTFLVLSILDDPAMLAFAFC